MKSFALNVARFLESDDSALTPLPEPTPLYPKLKPFVPHAENASRTAASSSSGSGSTSGGGSNYEEFLSTTLPPPTAPNFDSLEGFDSFETGQEKKQEQKQVANHNATSTTKTTHYVHETHVIHDRRFDSPVVLIPLASSTLPPPQTVVHVHNNGSGNSDNSRQPFQSKEKETKKNEKDEDNDGTMDRWVGGAMIAGSALAATVAISKASLRSKALHRLLEERKDFDWYAPGTAEHKFLKQFDATFGELCKSNTLTKRSAFSGGASAAAVGSLYYFGTTSGAAYFPFVVLGCASLVAGAYAYFYVADDRNTECRKLHAECKRVIESLE